MCLQVLTAVIQIWYKKCSWIPAIFSLKAYSLSVCVAVKPVIVYSPDWSPKLSFVLAKAKLFRSPAVRRGAQNFPASTVQLSSSHTGEQLWFAGNLSHILLWIRSQMIFFLWTKTFLLTLMRLMWAYETEELSKYSLPIVMTHILI